MCLSNRVHCTFYSSVYHVTFVTLLFIISCIFGASFVFRERFLYGFMVVSHVTVVTSIRNVPGSKWRLLSNVLVRFGNAGETVAKWNNSRSLISLFQGTKCDNVPKCDLEFA